MLLTPYVRNRSIWSPFEEIERQFFSDFGLQQQNCKTDIIDNGDHFLLEAELPGFEKDEIQLDIQNDTLELKAQRKQEQEESAQDGNYIRKERSYAVYARRFDVSMIDQSKIEAEYKNGVLTLKLPKLEEEVPPARRIEIQ